MDNTTITVIGCGYVGLTLASVLANSGFTVYAVEADAKRLDCIKQGKSFFYEAGIDPLLQKAIAAKRLIPTNSYEISIPKSALVFSCVGTPDNPDGSSNLTYVFDAATQAFAYMCDGAIFVQKSTVPVGTGAQLLQRITTTNKHIAYVSCPEFSREGTAVSDTLWYDRMVVGSADEAAAQKVLDVQSVVRQHQSDIAAIASLTKPDPLPAQRHIAVSLASAELIKVTANAFLALKISFANSIAKLADASRSDITEVMDGVGSDRRIGRPFLNAGRGFGGGCFPKDVSGLIRTGESYGVDLGIMRAAMETNDSMPYYIINKVRAKLTGNQLEDNVFKGKHIAILGLSFKAGTSDVRRSPAVTIANTLAEQGALIRAYDPEAMAEAKKHIDASVTLVDSLDSVVQDTDYIFLATDWPEFTTMDMAHVAELSGATLFVDCMNRINPKQFADTPLTYVGVGKH